jgi:hypothetical protein
MLRVTAQPTALIRTDLDIRDADRAPTQTGVVVSLATLFAVEARRKADELLTCMAAKRKFR